MHSPLFSFYFITFFFHHSNYHSTSTKHTNSSDEIISLNLVGLGLQEISDRVGSTFTSLRSLKLDSNKISTIPNNICQLPELRDISAVKNAIVSLPFNIGLLVNLRTLCIPNNRLTTLPTTMKLLVHLSVLNVECNHIRSIPMLGNLPLKRINFNNNKITSLMNVFTTTKDVKRGTFPLGQSLLVLSCNNNQLDCLPSKISTAVNLKELYLANNKLIALPSTLGNCKKIERFWVDWNPKLTEIPVSISNWHYLIELKAEGCPISRPPPELMFKSGGRQTKKDCTLIVQWCSKFTQQTTTNNYRGVIADLQKCLERIGQYDPEAEEDAELEKEEREEEQEEKKSHAGELQDYDSDDDEDSSVNSSRSSNRSNKKKTLTFYQQLCDVFEPNVRAFPKNSAKVAMMMEPDYDDGGVPLFYTFVLDALYERILPLLQPNYEALTMIPGAQEALQDEFFLHSKEDLIEAIAEYDDAYGPIGALYKSSQFKKCSCVDARGRKRVCIPPGPGKMCQRKPVVWVRMTITTPEQYQYHQLKRNEIKTMVSALNDCKQKATLYLESRMGKRAMSKRGKALAKESRVIKRNTARNFKNKIKNKKVSQKSEKKKKHRIETLKKSEVKYRKGLLKEQQKLTEEEDLVFGQAKEELDARLITIALLLDKGNCLENSDGEELDELNEEWAEIEDKNEEKDLVEDIDDLEELDSDEEEQVRVQATQDRMSWFELIKHMRVVAEEEYVQEQMNIVREAVEEQFALLKKVMKSWNSSAVKTCYEAWRDWAKKMAKSKKDSVLSKSKASELKTQSAEQKLMYEAMEAEKWTEGWDEFTERVFFEHIETGEIAWDVKPKRGFVSRK